MKKILLLGANLRWNQTGVTVAGTGTAGPGLNQFDDPACIEIDGNDTMYICDHHNFRILRWAKGASAGVSIITTGGTDHPEALTFDRNGFLYLTGHDEQRVVRYPPSFSGFTIVAGVTSTRSSALNHLYNPLGIDVDDNFNLYIAERDKRRVVRWARNATSGTLIVGTGSTPEFYGLLLSLHSSNQLYVSSETEDAVYLWRFGASLPSVTLWQVNASTSFLNGPRGIQYDTFGNLYVCDRFNQRVVRYCVNSTMGRVVVADNAATDLRDSYDLAFDSEFSTCVIGKHTDVPEKNDQIQRIFRYR